jgi:hypothetical protein
MTLPFYHGATKYSKNVNITERKCSLDPQIHFINSIQRRIISDKEIIGQLLDCEASEVKKKTDSLTWPFRHERQKQEANKKKTMEQTGKKRYKTSTAFIKLGKPEFSRIRIFLAVQTNHQTDCFRLRTAHFTVGTRSSPGI